MSRWECLSMADHHFIHCFQTVVFGRELKRGEYQQLPQNVRQQKTHEVMDIIRKRLLDRRQQQLDSSIV
jgi:hypothetical protein